MLCNVEVFEGVAVNFFFLPHLPEFYNELLKIY